MDYSDRQAKVSGYGGIDPAQDMRASGGRLIGAASAGEKRQLEVPGELERLTKSVEYADHSLNELFSRLEGRVTSQSVPAPAEARNQIAAVGPSSWCGQQIRDNANRVGGMGERIQELMSRLEV